MLTRSSILQAAIDKVRYNKRDYISPYEFQRSFINDGSLFPQRAFCAGNRVGKTEIGAYEMSYHLTGSYPDWWTGKRITNSGHEFIAVGISLKSTAKILQGKLFGTIDCRYNDLMGTGSIPRSNIVFDPMEKDGARIVSCSIKHEDGGLNTLYFFCASQEKDIMGLTLKGAWIDESDKTQCGALYSQCATRIMTTDGFLIQTFTPENGIDDVVRKFIDAEQDEENTTLKLHMASMYDAHVTKGGHITDAMIKTIQDSCPEFEWECRINGIPSAGAGACFPLKDSEFMIDDVNIQKHWPIVGAFDIGKVVDPSVVSFVTRNDEGVTILLEQIYLQGSIYDKDPLAMANAIKASKFPHALIIPPHDAGMNSASPESFGKKLLEYGINVYPTPFRNPADTQLAIQSLNQTGGQSVRSIETGLQEMRSQLKAGTLKVHKDCTEWWKEKQTYFYTDKGVPIDANNHCIDSSRYGILSFVGNLHTTVKEAMEGEQHTWRDLQPRLRY